MNEAQQEIEKFLRKHSDSGADLYKDAIALLDDENYGWNTRVRFITHALRELYNRIPEWMSGQRFPGRLEYKEVLKPIIATWREKISLERGCDEGNGLLETIEVPRTLAIKMNNFFGEHEKVAITQREKVNAIFQTIWENAGDHESVLPSIKQWMGLGDRFVKQAHESGKYSKTKKINLRSALDYSRKHWAH